MNTLSRRRIFFKTIMPLVLCLTLLLSSMYLFSNESNASTAYQEQAFRVELKEMILSGDTSTHNVNQYNLSYTEMRSVWNDLIYGEALIPFKSSMYMYLSTTKVDNVIDTIKINNIDSEYVERYQAMYEIVADIHSQLSSDMSDLDKIIYLHNYIVDNTTYRNLDKRAYYAFGPLYDGYAVCQGYTYALNLLLELEGIETAFVTSAAMNHGWTIVNLDGEWYHIDATWDDTRRDDRTYLLRSDNEFLYKLPSSHYSWYISAGDYTATSTKFSNWFVHDVEGNMFYYDGYWFYVDPTTGNLATSDAYGNNKQVLVEGSSISLAKLNGSILQYKVGTTTYELDLSHDLSLISMDEVIEEPVTVEADSIDSIDLNDISNWKSGNYYYSDGLYKADATRIALNNYVTASSGENYSFTTTHDEYKLLVREMDTNLQMINSHVLSDGDELTIDDDTALLGVSIYDASGTTDNFSDYESLFSGDFNITFKPDAPLGYQILNIDLNDINEWRSGNYYYTDGLYRIDETRIALVDYALCSSHTTYLVSTSVPQYRLLVREMNDELELITSHVIEDGNGFTTSDTTTKLAISLYDSNGETDSFSDYVSLFDSGYTLAVDVDTSSAEEVLSSGLEEVATEEVVEVVEEVVEEEITLPTSTNIISDVLEVNYSDFNVWRSGYYHYTDASYTANATRIALNNYVNANSNTTYEASSSLSQYKMLVRELQGDKYLISSHILSDGETFETSSRTAYLAISILDDTNSTTSFDEYETLFANGYEADIKLYTEEATTTVTSSVTEVEEVTTEPSNDVTTNNALALTMNDFNNWRTGNYYYTTGIYSKDVRRICLDDYYEAEVGRTFEAFLSNNDYHILVREMTSDLKLLASHNLETGDRFTVLDKTDYLAISIYDYTGMTDSFDDYVKLFDNGFTAYLD